MESKKQLKAEEESLVLCVNSEGLELRATPIRLTRHLVVFEVYNPYSILQLSEVLQEFQIFINHPGLFWSSCRKQPCQYRYLLGL